MKTDWKDDIYTERKLELQPNADGTVTPVDKTVYTQKGDSFGAKELTEIGKEINTLAGEVAATKKSVSDGKKKVAAAITSKKVPTADDATFDVMAVNIGKIKTGAGNAVPGDVRKSKTFSADAGEDLVGTLSEYKEYWNEVFDMGVESTNLYSFIPSGIYDPYDARGALMRLPIARVRTVGGVTAAKIWPGHSLFGVASSNKAVAGGTYKPGTAKKTLAEAGVALTSAVVMDAIDQSVWYNINNHQTVFNSGTYGLVGSSGAYYSDNLYVPVNKGAVVISDNALQTNLQSSSSPRYMFFRRLLSGAFRHIDVTLQATEWAGAGASIYAMKWDSSNSRYIALEGLTSQRIPVNSAVTLTLDLSGVADKSDYMLAFYTYDGWNYKITSITARK